MDTTAALVAPITLTVLGEPGRVFVGGQSAPAILLLHGGWGGAAMHWSRVWQRLAQHARVIAPDLPGLGDPSVNGWASLAEYVTWLNALLDGLGVEQVVCVGNSFGASLAWSFAGRSPQRCVGVVMIDGYPMPRTPTWMRWTGHTRVGRALLRAFVRRSYSPKAWPPAFADARNAPTELVENLSATPPRQIETFLDCLIAGDGPPEPRAPVLILWGEADRLPTTHLHEGRQVHAKIPRAQFLSLPNAGHFPQLERPDAFVDAIEAFIRTETGQVGPAQKYGAALTG